MHWFNRCLPVFVWLLLPAWVAAQRTYSDHSVLAVGRWFRLAVPAAGVYRIDAASLPAMGFSLPMPSGSVRLYGRPPGMPGEAASAPYTDDLAELAIEVVDGGDGQLQAGDHLLFYSAGPHAWQWDSTRQRFDHRLNLYSDSAFVYLTEAAGGKRIRPAAPAQPAADTLRSYLYRYWYEKDLYNLLSSGKEWFGERFQPGAGSSLELPLELPFPLAGSRARLASSIAARSVGSPAAFDILLDGNRLATHTVAALSPSSLDLFAREHSLEADFNPTASARLRYSFQSANGSALGWLNRFQVFADCALVFQPGRQLDFRSLAGRPGKTAFYQLAGTTAVTRVWRVSDPLEPVSIPLHPSGEARGFNDLHEKAEEYIAFAADPASVPAARPVGPVASQDLHGAALPQMVVVSTPLLLPAAERLADWHRQREGLQSLVVTTDQAYHEFSAGQPNPTAIRDLVKMFYDRAGGDSSRRPRYLLLFGDATYDFRGRQSAAGPGTPGSPGTSALPSFQSSFSLDPLSTYVSDDFFGLLDDQEDINSELLPNRLDIGIGRIPVSTPAAASDYIDKIILYHQPSTRGSWRNELGFIADDEDQNLHLQDAEAISSAASRASDRFLQQKIYLDAYPQESDAAGSRYPEVNRAISDQLQRGTLIWNYSGHGGFRRLAEEVVLEKEIVDGWQQNGRLPLFITATCDFAPFDNPAVESLGEYLLTRPGAGAIALMTTTRLVFAFSNRIMNANYLAAALQPLPGGRYRSLGEAVRDAKNNTAAVSADFFNNRKFTLLGDPALTLAFPQHRVKTTHVNDRPVEEGVDTLRAMQEVTVRGAVTGLDGQVLSGFNGIVYPQVLDQPYERRTLGNDPGSPPTGFQVQDRSLFKGSATVRNGLFQFRFIIPRDISYRPGNARILYYAVDSLTDAHGATGNLPVAGSAEAPGDTRGPDIRAWLNDTSFRNGGLANDRPLLLLRLADSSGINILGNGIGHDITAVLDGQTNSPLVLNAFFEADTDTYRRGWVRFQLPVLADGPHELRIKAWDQLNNSSETSLQFRVAGSSRLEIRSQGAWPNPSRDRVRFVFDHNRVNEALEVSLDVYTMEGRPVNKIKQTIISAANRSYMDWDGRDGRGQPVPPGVYVYRLVIRTGDGRQGLVVKKLVRL